MRATENGSASQVMLQGEDSEECPEMGVQVRQATSKPLVGVLLYGQQMQLTPGGRAALLGLQMSSQQAQPTSRRLHCSSSAECSGPVGRFTQASPRHLRYCLHVGLWRPITGRPGQEEGPLVNRVL